MVSAKLYFEGSEPQSLADLLHVRAERNGALPALTFIDDSDTTSTYSYHQLLVAADAVADVLGRIGPPGSRALLLYPSGSEFLIAFFGCALAGWTPVPTCFPKPGRPIERLDSIARCCQPSLLLTDAETLGLAAPDRWAVESSRIPRLATDQIAKSNAQQAPTVEQMIERAISYGLENSQQPLHPELALLQFTSGSTSEPKGVMVTHQNMMANLEAIRVGFGLKFSDAVLRNDFASVFWLPAFHDMGLIGGLLAPLYSGAHSIVMSPRTFLSRPLRWLKAISDFKALVTGAPNFAFQLCVDRIDGAQAEGLDLSSLGVVFCGAEPIQARTLEQFASRFAHTGFKRRALFPCYGLAESTLYVAGGHLDGKDAILTVSRSELSAGNITPVDGRTAHSDTTSRLVACGQPAIDAEVKIVSPEQRLPLQDSCIGEIWLRGKSVASSYWIPETATNKETYTSAFSHYLANEPAGSTPFLHTGDLGFLRDGCLYVTGRSKDLIILRGRNHYPQDIENSILQGAGTHLDQIAAVSSTMPGGEALAIVAELARTTDKSLIPDIIRQIRRVVIDQHEVDPRRVILVRTASIPRTTSGKIQRSAIREMLANNTLKVLGKWERGDLRADGAPLLFPELPCVNQQISVNQQTMAAEQASLFAASIEAWMMSWLMVRAGAEANDLNPERSLDQLGLDSLSTVELSSEIEDWLGLQLTPTAAFEHPTPRKLSCHLANSWMETYGCASQPTAAEHAVDESAGLSGKTNSHP